MGVERCEKVEVGATEEFDERGADSAMYPLHLRLVEGPHQPKPLLYNNYYHDCIHFGLCVILMDIHTI